MARFSDQFRVRVVGDEVRLSVLITERRIDEYHLRAAEVREALQSPHPGQEWEGNQILKVRIKGNTGLLGIAVTETKWEIYSMLSGHLIQMVAQLRAELGVG